MSNLILLSLLFTPLLSVHSLTRRHHRRLCFDNLIVDAVDPPPLNGFWPSWWTRTRLICCYITFRCNREWKLRCLLTIFLHTSIWGIEYLNWCIWLEGTFRVYFFDVILVILCYLNYYIRNLLISLFWSH